jgi:hypothetical protein
MILKVLLINKALEYNGSYYLPYHLFASQEQFNKAYPHFKQFLQLKRECDPSELLVNQLYRKYAPAHIPSH